MSPLDPGDSGSVGSGADSGNEGREGGRTEGSGASAEANSEASAEASAEATANPGVAVAVVARRLGVAPATLRTWDRRYGLGPSERSAGAHRRYSRDDVLRLMVMRRLTLEGIAPGDAARAALQADLEVERARRANAVNAAQEAAKNAKGSPQDAEPPTRVVHFSRPTLVTPPHEVTPGDVVDAALNHDAQACATMLAINKDEDILEWWNTLANPTFTKLTERIVLAKPGESPLKVFAGAAMGAVRDHQAGLESSQDNAVGARHPSKMPRIVLIFTAPDEPHPLPAHVLAAALGAQGMMARIVSGPANPHRAQELVAMVRPAAAVLITGLSEPDLRVVPELHEGQPELPILIGLGSDTAAANIPLAPTIQRVRTFDGLFHEVLAAVFGGR